MEAPIVRRRRPSTWALIVVAVVLPVAVGAYLVREVREDQQDARRAEAELAEMEVGGLRWTGDGGRSSLCLPEGRRPRNQERHPHAWRTYVVVGVEVEEVLRRVDAWFQSRGYGDATAGSTASRRYAAWLQRSSGSRQVIQVEVTFACL